jgi:hypothetical protein
MRAFSAIFLSLNPNKMQNAMNHDPDESHDQMQDPNFLRFPATLSILI